MSDDWDILHALHTPSGEVEFSLIKPKRNGSKLHTRRNWKRINVGKCLQPFHPESFVLPLSEC
jgi:hypothetical protein